MTDLIHLILFGDFGLLTTTPKYLFLILFPIMTCVGLIKDLILYLCEKLGGRLSFLINEDVFTLLTGLGCTTAALAGLCTKSCNGCIHRSTRHSVLVWTLILLIPCSSQLAIIATFASMVTGRVFVCYVIICIIFIAIIFAGIQSFSHGSNEKRSFSNTNNDAGKLLVRVGRVILTSLTGVLDSAASFCIGSVIISTAMYLGIVDHLCYLLQPLVESQLGLPPETVTVLLFNVLKRDFGSATLMMIGENGAFNAMQLTVLLVMMTFTVPCFNSTVLLFKEEGCAHASFIWLTSMVISLLLGKMTMLVMVWLFV